MESMKHLFRAYLESRNICTFNCNIPMHVTKLMVCYFVTSNFELSDQVCMCTETWGKCNKMELENKNSDVAATSALLSWHEWFSLWMCLHERNFSLHVYTHFKSRENDPCHFVLYFSGSREIGHYNNNNIISIKTNFNPT